MEKERALSTAVQQIERQYGKGSIMRLGESPANREISVIPTGSLPLDLALGIGGVPRGRVVEIYGPESAGKTTVALHIVAEAQRPGGVAAFVDAEHALDPLYAARIGVNIDELLISQPDTGEQALEIVEAWFAPVRSTSWWSTRWRRWCPRPRSRARWATPTSVSRPA